MKYRHYYIKPEYTEHQTYFGTVSGLPEAGMIEAPTIDEFEDAFHRAVDEALLSAEKSRHRRTVKLLVWGAAVAGLIMILAATLPSKDKHLQVVSESAAVAVQAKSEAIGFDLSWWGEGTSAKLCRKALSNNLWVDNYLIFNVGYVALSGKRQPISIGIFNQVITPSPEKMGTYLDDLIDSAESILDSWFD